jgi:calcineurin-like phosphoesterase
MYKVLMKKFYQIEQPIYTDLGICGSYESVFGRDIQDVMYSIRSGMPRKLEVENKNTMLNGIILYTLII